MNRGTVKWIEKTSWLLTSDTNDFPPNDNTTGNADIKITYCLVVVVRKGCILVLQQLIGIQWG